MTVLAATLLVTSSAAAMTWLGKDITTSSYSDCHGFAAGAGAGRLAVRYHNVNTMTTSITDNSVSTSAYQATCQAA